VEAAGLGHAMDDRLMAVHERFTALIQRHLEEAVELGLADVTDPGLMACAWFGALNEVVIRWLYTGQPKRLEEAAPALRTMLLRSIGYAEERAGAHERQRVSDGAAPGGGQAPALQPRDGNLV
jgi:hypothetical protein